jgi:hypothetical protein
MVAITQILAAGLMTISAVHALPQPQAAQPSATPTPAPTLAEDNAALFRDLFTAPTAVKRFQRLLVQGGSLLTGEALKKFTVFSFNNATPAPGAKGGATKAAVSFKPLTTSSLNSHESLGYRELPNIDGPWYLNYSWLP